MSKHILIFGFFLCLSLNAEAQWYLFPGKNKKGKPQEQVKTETPAETADKADTANPDTLKVEEAIPFVSDEYVYEAAGTIRVALMLPLKASSQPNGNFFEMYCGAMLAARDLGSNRISIDLNIYDSAEENIFKPEIYNSNDIILGPVNASHIYRAINALPQDKYIISPLEPKAETIADTSRVIQAPPSWSAQYDELARWIAADMFGSEGKLYVIKDKSVHDRHGEYLISRLMEENVKFEIIPSISRDNVDEGRNYYVIASDRDDFLSTNIRELGLSSNKCEPVLYTTSKARTLPIDNKLLYMLNTHMTANYFIDYDDPKVKKFVLSYRALFKSEPSSFAFQGYDSMYFFVRMCDRFGYQWVKKIEEFQMMGLQSDFRFSGEGITGYRNTAVRKILYSKTTMSTTLQ